MNIFFEYLRNECKRKILLGRKFDSYLAIERRNCLVNVNE